MFAVQFGSHVQNIALEVFIELAQFRQHLGGFFNRKSESNPAYSDGNLYLQIFLLGTFSATFWRKKPNLKFAATWKWRKYFDAAKVIAKFRLL